MNISPENGKHGAGKNDDRTGNCNRGIVFVTDPCSPGMADDGHEHKGKDRVQNEDHTHLICFGILNGKRQQVHRQ